MLQQTSSSQPWLGPLRADRRPRVVLVVLVLVLLVLVEVRLTPPRSASSRATLRLGGLAVVVRVLDEDDEDEVVAEQCARP